MQTTWAGDAWALRRELLPWMAYHARLGASAFYVLYDGADADVVKVLRWLGRASGGRVTLMFADSALASPPEAASYQGYLTKWGGAGSWGNRPGNWELMLKQGALGFVVFCLLFCLFVGVV